MRKRLWLYDALKKKKKRGIGKRVLQDSKPIRLIKNKNYSHSVNFEIISKLITRSNEHSTI